MSIDIMAGLHRPQSPSPSPLSASTSNNSNYTYFTTAKSHHRNTAYSFLTPSTNVVNNSNHATSLTTPCQQKSKTSPSSISSTPQMTPTTTTTTSETTTKQNSICPSCHGSGYLTDDTPCFECPGPSLFISTPPPQPQHIQYQSFNFTNPTTLSSKRSFLSPSDLLMRLSNAMGDSSSVSVSVSEVSSVVSDHEDVGAGDAMVTPVDGATGGNNNTHNWAPSSEDTLVELKTEDQPRSAKAVFALGDESDDDDEVLVKGGKFGNGKGKQVFDDEDGVYGDDEGDDEFGGRGRKVGNSVRRKKVNTVSGLTAVHESVKRENSLPGGLVSSSKVDNEVGGKVGDGNVGNVDVGEGAQSRMETGLAKLEGSEKSVPTTSVTPTTVASTTATPTSTPQISIFKRPFSAWFPRRRASNRSTGSTGSATAAAGGGGGGGGGTFDDAAAPTPVPVLLFK
ncbi:hypothetical protein HDU76_013029 [Blyttiomyces sp. JEL0837]|nr:hypothetical protein HDU76_013029 [Blyttiomyces sp. JEL0837]